MSIYEEVEIEDMEWEEEEQQYTYPCPCGDKFIITLVRLRAMRQRDRRPLSLPPAPRDHPPNHHHTTRSIDSTLLLP